MYFYCYVYIFLLYVYDLRRASWHSSATLNEGFPCFFFSCKANASVKSAKTGHGPQLSKIFMLVSVLFVLCRSVYFVCKCVLYSSQRVATQMQLTHISYHVHAENKSHFRHTHT